MNGLAIFTYATQHLVQSQWSVIITIWFPNTFAVLKGSNPLSTPPSALLLKPWQLRLCFPFLWVYPLWTFHRNQTIRYVPPTLRVIFSKLVLGTCISVCVAYVHICRGTRVYMWVHIIHRDRISHLNPERADLPNLAGQRALGILSLCSKPLCPPGIFVGSGRCRLQRSCLNVRHFKHFLSPSYRHFYPFCDCTICCLGESHFV